MTQISSGVGPPLHCADARPTATQVPPRSSNVRLVTSAMPPSLMFAAVAVQPPAPHFERTAQLAVDAGAFATGLSSRSVPGPRSARYVPSNVLAAAAGVAAVGGGGAALGLSCPVSWTAAKMPPAISTTTPTSAPIRMRGVRDERFGGGGGGAHCCAGGQVGGGVGGAEGGKASTGCG